jgi:hypothetical protein
MMQLLRNVALSACAFAMVSGSASADAPVHVRGTVATLTASAISVTTATGPVLVSLTPKTAFIGALPATMDAIKPGVFIGSANVGTSGPSRALEVVVFPPSMNGTAEGDYPWDLPAKGGGHTAMTNGTVGAPKMSSMTNATVSHMTTGTTRTLSVSYKGGTKQIVVGPGIPIVKLAPGSKSLLHAGAHVFVIAAPGEGGASALVVVVGERGAVPPM